MNKNEIPASLSTTTGEAVSETREKVESKVKGEHLLDASNNHYYFLNSPELDR